MRSAHAQTAWLYAAVSSSPQEATLDDQRSWAHGEATVNGWTITREFSGVASGAKGTRKHMDDLLRELRATPKAKRPARVLMIRLDRVGRGDGSDAFLAIAEIRKLGCIVHTREDGDLRIDRAVDNALPFFRTLAGAIENEARSDKWKATHAKRRAAGLHSGVVPFGVVLIDGKAKPYEPEAIVVRKIFQLARQGWGYTRIARWALDNAPAKKMHNGRVKPYRWGASSIKSLLRSTTIRGLVIPEDEWEATRAQRAPDFRSRAPKRWPWPLQGAIRCTCGNLLSGHCSGESRYRIRYYICRHHTLQPDRTSHPAHRADRLEDSFTGLLRSLSVDPDLPSFVIGDDLDVDEIRAAADDARRELAEIEKRRQRAWALAEEASIPADHLRARLAQLDDQQRAAENGLRSATAALEQAARIEVTAKDLADVFESLPNDWPSAPLELQQELSAALSELVEGLWADPEKRGQLTTGLHLGPEHVAIRRKTDDTITKKFIQSITE